MVRVLADRRMFCAGKIVWGILTLYGLRNDLPAGKWCGKIKHGAVLGQKEKELDQTAYYGQNPS